jgi:pSer/pThr/pTyr-binding forkhead associated (FHA) protein
MGLALTMLARDGSERPFPIHKPRIVIGRDSRCDLHVPLPSVDLRHCEIILDGQRTHLRDLGSTSGTLHNGRRVSEAELHPGDSVTVGPVTFVVRVDVARDPATGDIEVTTSVETLEQPDNGCAPA